MGSCFFIGHRETPDQVYPALLETIEHHITEYGVSEFVVGRYGNFDRLVIWHCRRPSERTRILR